MDFGDIFSRTGVDRELEDAFNDFRADIEALNNGTNIAAKNALQSLSQNQGTIADLGKALQAVGAGLEAATNPRAILFGQTLTWIGRGMETGTLPAAPDFSPAKLAEAGLSFGVSVGLTLAASYAAHAALGAVFVFALGCYGDSAFNVIALLFRSTSAIGL
jgi:hypothetical protein